MSLFTHRFRFSPLKKVICLSLFLSPVLNAQDYAFERIGFLPGEENTYSYANALSRDGSTVVGTSLTNAFIWTLGQEMVKLEGLGLSVIRLSGVSENGTYAAGSGSNAYNRREAFRWSAESGMQSLGYLTGSPETSSSSVSAISQNGRVIVGVSTDNNNGEAFRWTESAGMQGLGFLGPNQYGLESSTAAATNYNGDVVVGVSTTNSRPNSYNEAFRWTASEGMQGLGFIDGGGDSPDSIAAFVSDDGLVVSGGSTNANNRREAFRWTDATGMLGLGFIEGGGLEPYSTISGMNADGSVIVGSSTSADSINDGSYLQAFRWSTETGMVGLGYLGIGSTEPISAAAVVSADGSTIVGLSTNAQDGIEAFVWRNDTGMFSLVDFMSSNGTDLSGWMLAAATGISANGEIFTGVGYNPDGAIESWLVRIAKPEEAAVPPTVDPSEPEIPGITEKPQLPAVTLPPTSGFLSAGELHRSMSDMAGVTMNGLSVAQGALRDQRFISSDQCSLNALWNGTDNRYCAFMTGTGEFWRGDGTQGRGSVGVAAHISPSVTLGVSAYLGNQRYDLRLGGRNKLDSYGGSLFLNYTQGQEGLRAFGALTASHLEYDLRRHYRNGVSNITYSVGESSGSSLGGMAYLGWAFMPQDKVSFVPFAEASWAKATIDGYREYHGTFPVDFDKRKVNETDMRLGTEISYDVTNDLNINGSIAWAHRLSGENDDVSGTVIGWTKSRVSVSEMQTDWSEAALGANYKLTPDVGLSASASSMIGHSTHPDATLRLGVSVIF